MNYKEVDDEELNEDLVLLDCQECNVLLKNEVFRKKVVPLSIPIMELQRYLQVKGPNTLFASEIRVNDKWILVHQDKCLLDETKGATIQEIRMAYLIELCIEIITPQASRSINYQINSTQGIQQLKDGFEAECKLKAKLQKWTVQGREIEG